MVPVLPRMNAEELSTEQRRWLERSLLISHFPRQRNSRGKQVRTIDDVILVIVSTPVNNAIRRMEFEIELPKDHFITTAPFRFWVTLW